MCVYSDTADAAGSCRGYASNIVGFLEETVTSSGGFFTLQHDFSPPPSPEFGSKSLNSTLFIVQWILSCYYSLIIMTIINTDFAQCDEVDDLTLLLPG